MKKVVHTDKAPAAIGPYSQAIIAGEMVYIAGQIPIDPATGLFSGNDIESQTKQSMENIKAILQAVGLTMQDVVKVNISMKDMNMFAKMNQVYCGYFKEPYPARAAVEVARLPKDAVIEIEAIAYKG